MNKYCEVEGSARLPDPVYKHIALDNCQILVTHSGRELLRQVPGIWGLAREYKYHSERGFRHKPDCRSLIGSDSGGRVYSIRGTKVAVKDTRFEDAIWTVVNMERLRILAEECLPANIRVPRHYGAVVPEGEESAAVIFMEMVRASRVCDWRLKSEGMTREDLRKRMDEAEILYGQVIKRKFGVSNASAFLRDWHEANVLVSFDNPPPGYDLTFWVIDQSKARARKGV